MYEAFMIIFHIIMVGVILFSIGMAYQMYRQARRQHDTFHYIGATVLVLFAVFETAMYLDLLRILYFGGEASG